MPFYHVSTAQIKTEESLTINTGPSCKAPGKPLALAWVAGLSDAEKKAKNHKNHERRKARRKLDPAMQQKERDRKGGQKARKEKLKEQEIGAVLAGPSRLA